MNLLIVGHGRMGRLVEAHAGAHGWSVAGVIGDESGWASFAEGEFDGAEVAIDFTYPDAVRGNVERLAARGVNVVVGTTGWAADVADVRAAVEAAGTGGLSLSGVPREGRRAWLLFH